MERTEAPEGAKTGMSDAERRVAALIGTSRQMDRGYPDSPSERAAWEWMRRHAARTLYAERRKVREKARSRVLEALKLAATGELEDDDSGRIQDVATRIVARRPHRLARDLYWATSWAPRDAEARAWALPLLEAAAVLFRDSGQLEAAYALFGTTYDHWAHWGGAPFDERYPPPPRFWRHGIPEVYRREDGQLEWTWRIPDVEQVDWRSWDHVIGCGTRVDHAVLDALRVPRRKQIVLEVHRTLAYVVGRIPRLKGRVVVVDDVHEGETSQRLARLYDADVIAIGDLCCAHLVTGLWPVLQVKKGPAVDVLSKRHR